MKDYYYIKNELRKLNFIARIVALVERKGALD
jgi:hypothetical protein